MAAMLDKNGPDGKSVILPDSLSNKECVRCTNRMCQVSYTFAYGASENRIEEGQNVLELMRRKANEVISEGHPAHGVRTYVWCGRENGWMEREQASAAGY